ncbi:hypothetical protein R9C00_07090 [Flammeovirgaceae bacterium SG7u.111]|nr:hypothetical protein [Flammeovirgaceae bacterium SG7u.132]WPO37209.1 hypothetical protein R9C00_07090 [Flammeovirgaceae bacterium SG7u.111]
MSAAKVRYSDFTPEQKQFVDEKTLSATMKISRWLAFLSKVSRFDKENDGKIKKLMTVGIVSFVVAVVCFIVAMVSETLVIAAGSVLLIAVGIGLFVWRSQLKKNDINDYLRLFFLPVLHVLEAKSGSQAKLSASLDFRIPRKALTPEQSKVGVRKLKAYSPKYVAAKVTMKDQSVLEFAVADEIKDFSWTKTSASGKTKFKNKSKFVHQCLIKMTLAKSEYTWQGTTAPEMTVEEHNETYIVKKKVKLKTEGKENVLKVNAFFGAMQSIYEQFDAKNPANQANADAEKPRREREDGEHEEYYDDRMDMMVLPYIWYGSQFDQYDYDSVEYMESGDYAMDDDSVTAFDS